MISWTVRIGVINPLNRREHHMVRAKRVNRERAATQGCALVQLRPDGIQALRALPKPLVVTFTRFGVRLMDSDGVPAACKGIRDEVASILGTGDGPTAPVRWEYGQDKGEPCVRVEVWCAGEERAA